MGCFVERWASCLLSAWCQGLWNSTVSERCTNTSVRALPASRMSGGPEVPLSSGVSISSVAVGSTSCSVSHSCGCNVGAAIARGVWGASVCKDVFPRVAFPFLAYGIGPGCGKSCVDEALSCKCTLSANIPDSWAFSIPGHSRVLVLQCAEASGRLFPARFVESPLEKEWRGSVRPNVLYAMGKLRVQT